jgi:transposase
MRPKGDAADLEARRREAMRLLDEGVKPADVAARVGCHVKSVHRWKGLRSRGGHAALRARPNTGRPPRLTAKQRARLTTLLLKGALANGFPTDLWTCPRIVTLVHRHFGVEHHHDHVGRLMAAMGFTCQKPRVRADERDEDAIAGWLAREWVRIKKKPGGPAPPSCSSTRAAS